MNFHHFIHWNDDSLRFMLPSLYRATKRRLKNELYLGILESDDG